MVMSTAEGDVEHVQSQPQPQLLSEQPQPQLHEHGYLKSTVRGIALPSIETNGPFAVIPLYSSLKVATQISSPPKSDTVIVH